MNRKEQQQVRMIRYQGDDPFGLDDSLLGKMPVYKQQLTTEQAGFRWIFTECALVGTWLMLGVAWGIISAAGAPLFVCLLFTWIFWMYGISGMFFCDAACVLLGVSSWSI